MPNEKQDANQGVIDAPKSKGSRVKLKVKKEAKKRIVQSHPQKTQLVQSLKRILPN